MSDVIRRKPGRPRKTTMSLGKAAELGRQLAERDRRAEAAAPDDDPLVCITISVRQSFREHVVGRSRAEHTNVSAVVRDYLEARWGPGPNGVF